MIKKVRRAIDYRRFVRSLVTPGPDEVVFGFGKGTDAWDTLNHLWICGRCGEAEYDIDTDSEARDKAWEHTQRHDGVSLWKHDR